MTLRDVLEISAGNMRRMKLRTFLTVMGIVIAIAAFVSMLSFGAGNQQYITKQYNELGLFNTMQVFPKEEDNIPDSTVAAILDYQAVEKLSAIPGVNLAYPFDAYNVTVQFNDTVLMSEAQALPVSALSTKLFSHFAAGGIFETDSARMVVVSKKFLSNYKIENPDSVIGRQIILSVRNSSIDSGFINIFKDEDHSIRERWSHIRFDSLLKAGYRSKLISTELNAALNRFIKGYAEAKITICDTLTICGVLEMTGEWGRIKPLIIPAKTATKFNTEGFSSNPAELFAVLQSGQPINFGSGYEKRGYPKVTLDLSQSALTEPISDSIKALGFKPFSYAENFKEIKKFFVYFNMALGVIGIIALITASLGIVNTMVMSIIERTREIGVLKSLGANSNHIRILFLMESGLIGAMGATFGILMGWIITRIASFIAKMIMAKEGIEGLELFAMPLWLILLAFMVGFLVSIIAGFYPASRAAKVDPVEALRGE